MSLLKNISSLGKQISQEISLGVSAIGYQSLLEKAKRTSDEITLIGRQVFGVAQKAEAKFQDRKDCLFWISEATKQILINDQLLRKIKQDTVYLGTISEMLQCGNINAAEFALQFSNELKRQETNLEHLKNQAESKKRILEDTSAFRKTSETVSQNQRALITPFGVTDQRVIETINIINNRFPKFTGIDALGLISVQLQPKPQANPSMSAAGVSAQKKSQNASKFSNQPSSITNDPRLVIEKISSHQRTLSEQVVSSTETRSNSQTEARYQTDLNEESRVSLEGLPDLAKIAPRKSLTLKSALGPYSQSISPNRNDKKNEANSDQDSSFSPEKASDFDKQSLLLK